MVAPSQWLGKDSRAGYGGATEAGCRVQEKKRKAEDEAEEDLEGEEEDAAAVAEVPATDAVEPADDEVMHKAVMTRKDRVLYQSILNRQKAKRQKVKNLEKKRDALVKNAKA